MTTVVVLSGDSTQLLRELQKVEAGERKLEKQINEVSKAALDTAGSVEKIGKAGRYGQTEMDKLLRELRKTGPEGGRQARAIEKSFQEAGTHGRRSVGTIVREMEKLDPTVSKVARSAERDFKRVEIAGKKAFGADAVKQLASYATGWLSVQSVIGTTARLMEQVRQEQERALQTLESQQDPNQRLLQVSTDAADYQKLTSTADRLAVDFGISRDEARKLMFSARSEGFEGSAGFIARNAQVLGVGAQATVAGQIPGLFTNDKVSAEQAINMGLTAAQASRLNFEELARSMPSAAEGGNIAGAGATETFGALSVMAGRFKSGDTAADRLKAFGTAVSLDPTLAGSGIMGAVEKLRGMGEVERGNFLGKGQELNVAYAVLTEEYDRIQERITQIEAARSATGTAQSPVALKRAIANSDPEMAAVLERNQQANRREIANERRSAIDEASRRAQLDSIAAGAMNRGESPYGIALGEMAASGGRAVGGFAEMLGLQSTGTTNERSLNLARAIGGGRMAGLEALAGMASGASMTDAESQQLRMLAVGARLIQERDAMAEPGSLGVLTRGDVAAMMAASGQGVPANSISDDMRTRMTQSLRAASAANPRFGALDPRSLNPFNAMSYSQGAMSDIQSILPAAKLDALIAEMRRAANAAEATSQNTGRSAAAPNYSSGLQAGADAAGRPSF